MSGRRESVSLAEVQGGGSSGSSGDASSSSSSSSDAGSNTAATAPPPVLLVEDKDIAVTLTVPEPAREAPMPAVNGATLSPETANGGGLLALPHSAQGQAEPPESATLRKRKKPRPISTQGGFYIAKRVTLAEQAGGDVEGFGGIAGEEEAIAAQNIVDSVGTFCERLLRVLQVSFLHVLLTGLELS